VVQAVHHLKHGSMTHTSSILAEVTFPQTQCFGFNHQTASGKRAFWASN